MNNYLNSRTHCSGCIFLIFGCLVILFGSPQISWIYLLPFSYAIGCLIATLKSPLNTFFQAFRKSKKHKKISRNHVKTIESQSETSRPLINQLLDQLSDIEQKAKPFLKPNAKKLISDIDSIMKVMSNKLDESTIEELSLEIADIQRTLSDYLTPALEYYCSLPKFLHHRKIPNSEHTPHEIVELQLKIIQEEMLKISETIYENDLHQLIDHGQFLKMKLSNSEFFHISIH